MASTSPNPSFHPPSDAAKPQEQSVPSLQTQPPQQNPPHPTSLSKNPNPQPQSQINFPHPQHIIQMQMQSCIQHFYDENMQNLAAGHAGNANAISQLEQVQAREMAIRKASRTSVTASEISAIAMDMFSDCESTNENIRQIHDGGGHVSDSDSEVLLALQLDSTEKLNPPKSTCLLPTQPDLLPL
ncbi:MAG: hypothetical protein ASARMPREDX12_005539 [Alectoria sarmentosa]|nr:MAG: hypothetical protein ASARMPREDX12_005539 [Alectoria sarmentosa]